MKFMEQNKRYKKESTKEYTKGCHSCSLSSLSYDNMGKERKQKASYKCSVLGVGDIHQRVEKDKPSKTVYSVNIDDSEKEVLYAKQSCIRSFYPFLSDCKSHIHKINIIREFVITEYESDLQAMINDYPHIHEQWLSILSKFFKNELELTRDRFILPRADFDTGYDKIEGAKTLGQCQECGLFKSDKKTTMGVCTRDSGGGLGILNVLSEHSDNGGNKQTHTFMGCNQYAPTKEMGRYHNKEPQPIEESNIYRVLQSSPIGTLNFNKFKLIQKNPVAQEDYIELGENFESWLDDSEAFSVEMIRIYKLHDRKKMRKGLGLNGSIIGFAKRLKDTSSKTKEEMNKTNYDNSASWLD